MNHIKILQIMVDKTRLLKFTSLISMQHLASFKHKIRKDDQHNVLCPPVVFSSCFSLNRINIMNIMNLYDQINSLFVKPTQKLFKLCRVDMTIRIPVLINHTGLSFCGSIMTSKHLHN